MGDDEYVASVEGETEDGAWVWMKVKTYAEADALAKTLVSYTIAALKPVLLKDAVARMKDES